MFLVFNRDKIKSYIILLGTILVLFGLTLGIKKDKTVETKANAVTNIVETKDSIVVNKIKTNTNIVVKE